MNTNPVKQRHEKVIIIGGGESLSGFDFSKLNNFDGAIIAINNNILYLPRADYWITIDMGWDWKHLISPGIRKPNCYYYAGVPNNLYDESIFMFVHQLHRVKNFTDVKTEICGGNSGLAALNLAFHFEPKKILMLGIDCFGFGHWYDKNDKFIGNNEKIRQQVLNIPRLFERAVVNFLTSPTNVINASPYSRVECFKKNTIEEGLKWIS